MKDVHTEHCCLTHGCKYGKDEECTVMLGRQPQSFPCEECETDKHDPDKQRIIQLENALCLVLDYYAAQIPTPSKDIDAAKALVNWVRSERYS